MRVHRKPPRYDGARKPGAYNADEMPVAMSAPDVTVPMEEIVVAEAVHRRPRAINRQNFSSSNERVRPGRHG